MVLRRFLGLDRGPSQSTAVPGPGSPAETETVRRIVAQLESMPTDRARYLAGLAYILSRAARADLTVSPEETGVIESQLATVGGLPEAEAVLVVEIAKTQARLYGATEDYLVTRDFAAMTTVDQRLALLRCCFVVAAADGSISAAENATIAEIANELQLDADQLASVRVEFADKLSAVQALRRAQRG